MVRLEEFVQHFTDGLIEADCKRPQANDTASGALSKPGIGPFAEDHAVNLIVKELELAVPSKYAGRIAVGVPYPDAPERKCDLCIGTQPDWEWAVQVKMLRYVGEDGQLSDSILRHHRSAVRECLELANSSLGENKALLIYGFEHEHWPLDPAIDAFEKFAQKSVPLGSRHVGDFDGLMHPIYSLGRVFSWALNHRS